MKPIAKFFEIFMEEASELQEALEHACKIGRKPQAKTPRRRSAARTAHTQAVRV